VQCLWIVPQVAWAISTSESQDRHDKEPESDEKRATAKKEGIAFLRQFWLISDDV
jgi:hypothetical protein